MMDSDFIAYGDQKVEVPPAIDWSVLGEQMPDGLYFGLDEQTYRQAGAINASILKDIGVSCLTAWTKNISPEYQDESTDAQDEGTALHKRLLEGEDAFRLHCAVRPENDGSYAEGQAELKELCKHMGLKVGGTIPDLCARILEADPIAKLWPLVMKDFNKEHAGKIILKQDVWERLELRARLVRLHPDVKNAFEGGFPEVSCFWHDPDGTPCKCRFDYLKIIGAVDLKYFANMGELPIAQAVNRAIRQHRIQARHYIDGLRAAKGLVRAGKVFGVSPDSQWKDAFAADPGHRFFWVFVQKGPVPEVEPVEFAATAKDGASENVYYTDATDRIDSGKRSIRLCLETYGADPWVNARRVRILTDEDQPDLLWRT